MPVWLRVSASHSADTEVSGAITDQELHILAPVVVDGQVLAVAAAVIPATADAAVVESRLRLLCGALAGPTRHFRAIRGVRQSVARARSALRRAQGAAKSLEQVPGHLSTLATSSLGRRFLPSRADIDALLGRRRHPLAASAARGLAQRLGGAALTPLVRAMAPAVITARVVLMDSQRRMLMVPLADAPRTPDGHPARARVAFSEVASSAEGAPDGGGTASEVGPDIGESSGWVDLAPFGVGIASIAWRVGRAQFCPSVARDPRCNAGVDGVVQHRCV